MARLVVLDTKVLVAGLRSRRGASHRLLRLLAQEAFSIALSVPLVLEYEAVLKREQTVPALTDSEVEALVDYLCRIGQPTEVHFRWRPVLKDPADDHLLELAAAAGGVSIVTFNVRDFAGSERLGVRVLTPQAYLDELGELR